MTMKAVKATHESFGRFGAVVAIPSTSPTSQGPDYSFWSDIAHFSIPGETEIGICTVYAQPAASVTTMERHLRTPEILVPIDAPVVLPLATGAIAPEGPAVFRVEPGEAVVVADGIWHGACIPVGKTSASYFVIFRRGTPLDDVQNAPVVPFSIDEA
jgi:ureidoglycolate hydrolase